MPKSRSRHRSRPRDLARARRLARSDRQLRPRGVDPQRWAAMLAEARGDAATASRLLSDCANEDDAQHLADLAAMERHGEQAPPWLVGRWITRQALRWMRLRGDERYEQSLYLCLQGTYWSRAELTAGDLPPEYARALADDWVTRELALYGYRVLDEFLDDVAHPRLVEAAGSVASWTRMPLRPYRLVDRSDDRLVVSDRVTGCGHEVFDLGTGAFYPIGAEVLGRLVPIDDELWMFETLPLLIDCRTSIDVASALPPHHTNPLPWAPLLTRAIDQGRLPRMLGAGLRTPVFDDLPLLDLPDMEWEPPPDERWAELVAAGLDDEMAGWVQVLEEALTMLPQQPAWLQAVVDSLDRVLASETALAVVRDQLTGVEVAAGWEALARRTDGDLRRACVDLAATARERRWRAMVTLRLVSDDEPEPLAQPDPGECVACFLDRTVGTYGCSDRLTWAGLWRDRAAPRATALERRLRSGGGYCDCEVLMNVFARRTRLVAPATGDDADPGAEPPPCLGVRKGSTRPCDLWV